eukprot:m.54349 g.54349  ORF g.54349 m.54349 type:complete len:57 (+) comp7715_c0_seq1:217-387(+)
MRKIAQSQHYDITQQPHDAILLQTSYYATTTATPMNANSCINKQSQPHCGTVGVKE